MLSFRYVLAIAAVALALWSQANQSTMGGSATSAPAMGGSATSGRAAQPARPLPKGKQPPKVDFHDVAAAAGLTAINISGDPKHNSYIVETTGNGLALFD